MFSAVAKRLVRGGGGGVVLLNGQEGSGKTHLLQSPQITALSSSLGFETVTSFCSGVYTTTPYFAWRAILRSVFSLPTANISQFPDSGTTARNDDDYYEGCCSDGTTTTSSNVVAPSPFHEVILKNS